MDSSQKSSNLITEVYTVVPNEIVLERLKIKSTAIGIQILYLAHRGEIFNVSPFDITRWKVRRLRLNLVLGGK